MLLGEDKFGNDLEEVDNMMKAVHEMVCYKMLAINDDDNHYRAIAELSRKYDMIDQVNLMTYHDMAKGKAAQIGETYPLENLKTVEKEQKYRIYERVEQLGCLRLEAG